jgi:hypothetical protein
MVAYGHIDRNCGASVLALESWLHSLHPNHFPHTISHLCDNGDAR